MAKNKKSGMNIFQYYRQEADWVVNNLIKSGIDLNESDLFYLTDKIRNICQTFDTVNDSVKQKPDSFYGFIKKGKDELKAIRAYSKTSHCNSDRYISKAVNEALDNMEKFNEYVGSVNNNISAFNNILTAHCPKLTTRKRAIIISEALSRWNAYDEKPFLTLEQAEAYSLENDILGTGEDIIYNRLKKYLKK